MIDYPRRKGKTLRSRKKNRKQPLSELIRKSIRSLLIALTLINALLLTLFLVYNGDTAQMGYILKKTQDKTDNLELQQRVLESKLIESQKASTLNESETINSMEPATDDVFQYLN